MANIEKVRATILLQFHNQKPRARLGCRSINRCRRSGWQMCRRSARLAAKMVVIDIDHPDIESRINVTVKEELPLNRSVVRQAA